MPLRVHQRHPVYHVLIVKNANNIKIDDGHGGSTTETQNAYELTTYGGKKHPEQDLLNVYTKVDIGEVAGTFRLKLTARRDEHNRTYAHLIEPMDYVEIHLKSNILDPDSGAIMRGFVDTTTLVRNSSVSGDPETYVLIDGRNYGKLWLRNFYFVLSNHEQVVPGNFPVDNTSLGAEGQSILGSAEVIMNPVKWIKAVFDRVTDPTMGLSAPPDGAPLMKLLTDDLALNNYAVPNPLTGPFTGSIWNYLSSFENKPFFEMFITDDVTTESQGQQTTVSDALTLSGAPSLVWRRAPLKDYFDKERDRYITEEPDVCQDAPQTDHSSQNVRFPNAPDIPYENIINMTIGRSDQEEYTYFLAAPAKNSGMDDTPFWAISSYLHDHGGAAYWDKGLNKRFGFLPLDPQTTLWPVGAGGDVRSLDPRDPSTNTQTIQEGQVKSDIIPKIKELSCWLEVAYAPNYLFEQGNLVIKGTPDIRMGRYVKIADTGQEFYVEGVEQNFNIDPLDYRTTVTLTRGRWPDDKRPYTVVNPDDGSIIGPFIGTTFRGYENNAPPPTGGGSGGGGGPTPPPGPSSCAGWNNPVSSGMVCTQGFGCFGSSLEPASGHAGTDFGAGCGVPTLAVSHGRVTWAGMDPRSAGGGLVGLGNRTEITLDNGDVIIYGHQTSIEVSVGQVVNAGDKIGTVGDTGAAEGCHLHLEWHPNNGSSGGICYSGPCGAPIDAGACYGFTCACR